MSGRVASPTFVGRVEELELLEAARRRAADGEPAVVLVGGEAGVGKTRLVAELAEHWTAEGSRVLAGGCVPVGEGALPYAPILEALRPLSDQLGVDTVRELAGPSWPELARLLPSLGEPDPSPVGKSAQARLFELLLGLLNRLSGQTPIALVVEDLHWADRSTRDLLAFLGPQPAPEPRPAGRHLPQRRAAHRPAWALARRAGPRRLGPALGAAPPGSNRDLHGRDLTELDADQLDQARLNDLWQQVASLRAARIAHRDLGPDSVMVDEQGQMWLVDFDRAEAAASQPLLDRDLTTLLHGLDGVADPGQVRATAQHALGQDTVERLLPPHGSTLAAPVQAARGS